MGNQIPHQIKNKCKKIVPSLALNEMVGLLFGIFGGVGRFLRNQVLALAISFDHHHAPTARPSTAHTHNTRTHPSYNTAVAS